MIMRTLVLHWYMGYFLTPWCPLARAATLNLRVYFDAADGVVYVS